MAGGLAKEKYDQYKVTPSLATVTKNVTLGMRSPMTLEAKEGRERSFIMIKPDGVQRGLVGEIIKRFEQKGFKLVAIRSVVLGENHNYLYCYLDYIIPISLFLFSIQVSPKLLPIFNLNISPG